MVTKTKAKSVAKPRKTDEDDSSVDDITAQGGAAATASSLEQVRNILFGEQVREQNLRYESLKNEIDVSISQLKADTGRDINALRKEADKALLAEHEHSEKSTREIHQRLDDLQHSMTELDGKLERIREELYGHIESESKFLSDQMHDLNEKTLARLESSTASLQDDKMDRKTLADLLNAMAATISKGKES